MVGAPRAIPVGVRRTDVLEGLPIHARGARCPREPHLRVFVYHRAEVMMTRRGPREARHPAPSPDWHEEKVRNLGVEHAVRRVQQALVEGHFHPEGVLLPVGRICLRVAAQRTVLIPILLSPQAQVELDRQLIDVDGGIGRAWRFRTATGAFATRSGQRERASVARLEERNSAVAYGAVDAIPSRVTSAEAKRASATTVALVEARVEHHVLAQMPRGAFLAAARDTRRLPNLGVAPSHVAGPPLPSWIRPRLVSTQVRGRVGHGRPEGGGALDDGFVVPAGAVPAHVRVDVAEDALGHAAPWELASAAVAA